MTQGIEFVIRFHYSLMIVKLKHTLNNTKFDSSIN